MYEEGGMDVVMVNLVFRIWGESNSRGMLVTSENQIPVVPETWWTMPSLEVILQRARHFLLFHFQVGLQPFGNVLLTMAVGREERASHPGRWHQKMCLHWKEWGQKASLAGSKETIIPEFRVIVITFHTGIPKSEQVKFDLATGHEQGDIV